MLGGTAALIGAAFLGPRIGRFNEDGSANDIPGHSVTVSTWLPALYVSLKLLDNRRMGFIPDRVTLKTGSFPPDARLKRKCEGPICVFRLACPLSPINHC